MNKILTIPIFIPHMGCPHKCVFCNQYHISSSLKVPENYSILKKIKEYKNTSNSTKTELAYFGGSFTAIDHILQIRLLKLANSLKKSNIIQRIRISTRPDYIDEQICKLLKKYNVDIVELGAQSFDNTVLMKSERMHTPQDTMNACEILKNNGIKFGIQLMPGLPGDTYEKSIQSALITADLKPDCVRIYPTIVLKDTKLADMYNSGKYNPLELEDAIEVSKEMVNIFSKNKIYIKRIGLHPFSKESRSSILAGPYHDSFGYFVKSRIKRDQLANLITTVSMKKDIIISLPIKNVEEYIGYKKSNLLFIRNILKKDFYYIIDKSRTTPEISSDLKLLKCNSYSRVSFGSM